MLPPGVHNILVESAETMHIATAINRILLHEVQHSHRSLKEYDTPATKHSNSCKPRLETKTRCRVQLKGPRRSSLGEGEVIEHLSKHDNTSTELLRNMLCTIEQQQQQIAFALGTVNALSSDADTNSNTNNNTCAP
ncbi:uncharacterized protein LOC134222712 [Armigeres subalbatus]|uniref:uncharacterized protein LOC134222712 n=1 Tax=Armigeres subalbatus TaxID=124917 RepID=UPI002ED40A56